MDTGVVVGGVYLTNQSLPNKIQCIHNRALNSGMTTESERVLKRTLGVGLFQITSFQIAAANGGSLNLAWEGTQFIDTLTQRLKAAVQSL
ncbi:hypothetical protein DSECCO2_265710 [anaerobic digester metagenome]